MADSDKYRFVRATDHTRKRARTVECAKESDAEQIGASCDYPSSREVLTIPKTMPSTHSPSHLAFVQQKWEIVHQTVCCLLRREMSPHSFQTTHHAVFRLCQRRCGGIVFDSMQKTLEWHVDQSADELLKVGPSAFLVSLRDLWRSFVDAIQNVSGVMVYFTKNYCVPEHRPTIRSIAFGLFATRIVRRTPISHWISQSLSGAVTSGDVVTLQIVAQMLARLDRQECYEAIAESPYLAAIQGKYVDHTAQLLQELTVPEFLHRVRCITDDEQRVARQFLLESSVKKVEDLISTLFISSNAATLMTHPTGGESMLQKQDFGTLRTLRDALAAVNNTDVLVQAAAAFVAVELEAVLRSTSDSASERQGFAVNAVNRVLELRRRQQKLCDALCGGEQQHQQLNSVLLIEKAFLQTLNSNKNVPKWISLYVDHYVRVKETNEDREAAANNAISLIRCLKDREAFEMFYKTHLASRLLVLGTTELIQRELVFMNRLREEWGSSAVHRIVGMLEDIQKTDEQNEKFTTAMVRAGTTLPLEMRVTVLAVGYWPSFPEFELRLPQPLEVCAQHFRNYYERHHNARILRFQANNGVVTLALRNAKRRYELSAATHVACVLMCFNCALSPRDSPEPRLTVQQVSELTGLSAEEAGNALRLVTIHGLLCAENQTVFVSKGGGRESTATADSCDVYRFNTTYSPSRPRIRISASAAAGNNSGRYLAGMSSASSSQMHGFCTSSQDGGASSISHDTARASFMSTDAAIVRVLKAAQEISHDDLVKAVRNALPPIFVPTMVEIKAQVEVLLEKGFLSRAEDDRTRYVYIP